LQLLSTILLQLVKYSVSEVVLEMGDTSEFYGISKTFVMVHMPETCPINADITHVLLA